MPGARNEEQKKAQAEKKRQERQLKAQLKKQQEQEKQRQLAQEAGASAHYIEQLESATGPKTSTKKSPTFKNFVFTINNYTDEHIANLQTLAEDETTRYLIAAREIGEQGTPHLQGFVQTKKKFSKQAYFKLFRSSVTECYITPLLGQVDQSRIEASLNYCKKGQQTKDEWEQHGIRGPNFGKEVDIAVEVGEVTWTGRRKDLEVVRDKIIAGATKRDIMYANPTVYAKHPKFVQQLVDDVKITNYTATHSPDWDWEKLMLRYLEAPRQHRTIYWIHSFNSGTGKTEFGNMAFDKFKHNYLKIEGGYKDAIYAYDGHSVVHMALPREIGEDSWKFIISTLEKFSDGGPQFCSKYESAMKVVDCKVFVTSNDPPPTMKIPLRIVELEVNRDRWVLKDHRNNAATRLCVNLENCYCKKHTCPDDSYSPEEQAKIDAHLEEIEKRKGEAAAKARDDLLISLGKQPLQTREEPPSPTKKPCSRMGTMERVPVRTVNGMIVLGDAVQSQQEDMDVEIVDDNLTQEERELLDEEKKRLGFQNHPTEELNNDDEAEEEDLGHLTLTNED